MFLSINQTTTSKWTPRRRRFILWKVRGKTEEDGREREAPAGFPACHISGAAGAWRERPHYLCPPPLALLPMSLNLLLPHHMLCAPHWPRTGTATHGDLARLQLEKHVAGLRRWSLQEPTKVQYMNVCIMSILVNHCAMGQNETLDWAVIRAQWCITPIDSH